MIVRPGGLEWMNIAAGPRGWTIPVLVDFLEVDGKLARILLGVGESFRSEESDDVVRDNR